MPAQIWKPIEGFPGYEVSDQGRVRSFRKPVYLKPARMDDGRPAILLQQHGVPKRCLVYRLVLNAFVGPPPPGCEACHNDGNPGNNRLKNLRWDTHRANSHDRVKHGTMLSGPRHPAARVTRSDARKIKALLRQGWTGTAVAQRLGLCKDTVSSIKRGKHWTTRNDET